MNDKLKKHGKLYRFNLKPGFTVGLVSIPLSISLAIASGVSPVIGIISAFWGGAIASFFAGSIYNIIGPTGALSGLILAFALSHEPGLIPVLTITTGLIILIAYILNFHKYLIYIPGAVIHGFTLGVAFVIGLGQFNNAFGIKPAESHETLISNIIESFKAISTFQIASAIVFALGLLFLITMKKKAPKLPGAIVLTFIGIVLGGIATMGYLPFQLPTLLSKYGSLTLNLFPNTMPQVIITPALFQSAFVIAFIAIIETMLSAKVAEMMTKTKCDDKKEMLALALANIVAGIMGGIPVTAALARTSLNIKSGANSNKSASISALTIGIISIVFFKYFQFLPLPIVAAILVNVAINMVEKEHFNFLFKHDKLSFGIAIVVGAVTLLADPIIAVTGGSIIMLLRQVERISNGDFELYVNKNKEFSHVITENDFSSLDKHTDPLIYSFKGYLTYINSEAHIERLEEITKNTKNVVLRFRAVAHIDPDGMLMLEELVETLEHKKINVYFCGISESIIPSFKKTGFFDKYLAEGKFFDKSADALEYIYKKK